MFASCGGDLTACGPALGFGTALRVGLPPGEALGQGRVSAFVTGADPRLVLSIQAESATASGRLGTHSTLFFAQSEVSRDEQGVRLVRETRFERDWAFGSSSSTGWYHQLSRDPEVFADVGGPALLLGADLRLTPERQLSGSLTVVPTNSVLDGPEAVRPEETSTISVEGEVAAECLDERNHFRVRVGLDNPACAALFDGFDGLQAAR